MKCARRLSSLGILFLAAACAGSSAGGGTSRVNSADAFYARTDGKVAFVVFTSPAAMLPGVIRAKARDPGPESIGTSWLAHDGAEVALTSSLPGDDSGIVVIDGQEYGLEKTTIFAVRRNLGRTEVMAIDGGDLAVDRFDELLAARPEIKEYLGLDRPAPVIATFAGKDGMFFGFEYENVSKRAVRSISFRYFDRDAAGNLPAPGGITMSVEFPAEKFLKSGEVRAGQFPLTGGLATADILVTHVEFVSGEPKAWVP